METALKRLLPDGRFDGVTPQRSRQMAAVKGRGNKTTETSLRMALVRSGISGWRMHPRGIRGKPDFFFPDGKAVVFVDGCFWHGCPDCGHIPRKNSAFWKAKIKRNRQRDHETTDHLRRSGFRVTRLWEHEIQADSAACVRMVQAFHCRL